MGIGEKGRNDETLTEVLFSQVDPRDCERVHQRRIGLIDPEAVLINNETFEELIADCSALTPRQRQAIVLRLDNPSLTLREVGDELGFSESRASQIFSCSQCRIRPTPKVQQLRGERTISPRAYLNSAVNALVRGDTVLAREKLEAAAISLSNSFLTDSERTAVLGEIGRLQQEWQRISSKQ